ncbi:MAG: NAD(P)-binding domain-containing protein [Lachnospiraceae bacterium]|nr:NAD(P)-binding domain-containing protein [Lachnospiraceae bacterium]
MANLPTLGFLGSGAITTAMVTGFCDRAKDTPYPIMVADINQEAADKLAGKFRDRVTAAKTLQECVDNSDWVILAVWPDAGEEMIKSLTFKPEHKIINVMFDKTVEQVKGWMNCEPATILHMIPGTFLSFFPSPIVQCPPTAEAAEIFGHIGKIVNVDSRYQVCAFATITALFAPIFALMDTVIDWAVNEEGAPVEAATQYTTNMFAAVCEEACGKDKAGVHHMATVSTPGGINMQALELLHKDKAFDIWYETLKPIMARCAEGIPKK